MTPHQSSLIWALIALLFPPLPVAIRKGCSGHLILNIILLLLAWFPAVLHAWYVLIEYDKDGQKRIDRRIRRARDEQRVEVLQQGEKGPLEGGNMQGWYAPPVAPGSGVGARGVQQRDEEREIQPVVRPQTPEYARDVKGKPQNDSIQALPPRQQPEQLPQYVQQGPEYARDVKQG